jgi:hypothetical protein
MTLDEFIDKAYETPFKKEEVEAFCANEGIAFTTFCDAVARRIAVGYASPTWRIRGG